MGATYNSFTIYTQFILFTLPKNALAEPLAHCKSFILTHIHILLNANQWDHVVENHAKTFQTK